jgi:hypothetical protein
LANLLSISPNQIKFLLPVYLVPGLDLSAIPVSISAVSLGRLSAYILFRFEGDTFFKSFSSTLNMFTVFQYSNIATVEFLVISAETACWEKEKNSKIFNEDFYLPLYLPLWSDRYSCVFCPYILFEITYSSRKCLYKRLVYSAHFFP